MLVFLLLGSSFLHAQNSTDSTVPASSDTALHNPDSCQARVEWIEAPAKLQQLREEAETKEKEEKRRNKVRIVVGTAAVAIIIILLIRRRRRSS